MAGEEAAQGNKKIEGPDANSPLYIHASDYPKQMHVNEALTDNNYADWSQEMMNFLFAKNKVGFIDGSIEKPEEKSIDYMPWMRCDAMIKGWLTTAMENEIRTSVKYANTASEIWADLKERFGKESAPRAYELKQTLSMTHQNGATVSVYYTKLRSLWDEIGSVLPVPRCECNGCKCDIGKRISGLKDKERLYEFLMGLDNNFSVIRTQILAMNPIPSLGNAYHLVAEDERQRAISADKKPAVEAAAFKTHTPMRREGNQNQKRDKPVQKEVKRGDVVEHCTFCGKDGHSRDGCFKRIGYPEWWPGNKKREETKPKAAFIEPGVNSPIPGLTNEQYESFLKHFSGSSGKEDNAPKAFMAGKGNNVEHWVVDSGSTEHITNDASILENQYKNTFETPVIIPNGDAIPVTGKGECFLPGGTKIKGVLHIPTFTCNLLSVSRLSNDLQTAITFFPDFCAMQKLYTRDLIGAGECRNGLYRMGMIGRERKAMTTTIDTWHKRLGHASGDKLTHIDFLRNSTFDQVCDSCSKAKHTKLPFPSSNIKTNDCFELIHCDIWGKYRVPSSSKATYFLTIVDDFSRSVWVFLLKFKHEASNCLINFHTMVKTQFGKPIKRIRSDNGGEFTSNEMKEFYNNHGILLETSYPRTPQQNGVVERKHRHLLETARALMFEASLPKRFWGECVLTSAFLINRLPSKVIQNKTPYEIVFGHKPDYDFLKIFGCLAYYRNTVTDGDKFEERGRPGVFLGYPQGTKGYKIYDLKENKIIISRDVRFCENKFPFYEITCPQDTTDPFDLQEPLTTYDDFQESFPSTSPSPNNDQNSDIDMGQEDIVQNQVLEEVEDQVGEEDQTPNSSNPPINPPDRPKRHRSQPKILDDFIVNLPPSLDTTHSAPTQTSSTVHSMSNFVSYEHFCNSHRAFLAAICNAPNSGK